MNMRFRYAVSFESDLRPVHTVRGEFDKDDFESACKSALFLAGKEIPRHKCRSWVCCVEMLEEKAAPAA
jgi:hypothetical protein